MRSLTDAELLYVRGIAPDATYQFKHALIRDAAYEALLKSRRKELHLIVARTIDEQFSTLKETHPEILARHWTEAGEVELAISAWTRAGKAAESRNAFKEALESYRRAVTFFNKLPESAERELRELVLRQSVVSMLSVTRGYAARETIEAIEQAISLAERNGNLTQKVNWLTLRGSTLLVSGELSAAATTLDQTLELALRQASSMNLGVLYQLLTITRYWRGDLAGAEKHFAAGLEFFCGPRLAQSPSRIVNVAVNAFAFASFNAWVLGRANVAREREGQMLEVANRGSPFEVANSEYCAALLEFYIRDYSRAEALAEHALELAEKNQFPNPAARARTILGIARAQLVRADEGVKLIRQGLAGLREIGTRMGITSATLWLAEAQACEGALGDAFETVELAFRVHPDELVYRPQALWLRGEIRLKQGDAEVAEVDFCEAIALAQSMSGKTWELRATTSLARLLVKQGRRDEARSMLADIYDWFTEGFDTADLKDAKALLDELST